jgi:hypothetical protein
MLYARKIALRNCGRFSVIASDFGSDYRTHTHVSGEALYASLTRGITWRPRPIVIRQDDYDFRRDYDVAEMPVWFTPGIFLNSDGSHQLTDRDTDANFFNAVHEFYPSTSGGYKFDRKTDELKPSGRPAHVPTYGTWQAIMPGRSMVTYAFSPDQVLLETYQVDQAYLLGKKRTMMQVVALSKIIQGEAVDGACITPWLQVASADVTRFRRFEVLAGTVRYVIMRGETRPTGRHMRFSNLARGGQSLCLPDFYLAQTPLPL